MESTLTNAPRKLAIKLRARSKTMASEASKEAVPARSKTPDNRPRRETTANETYKESVPARPVTPDNGPLFRPDWRNPLDAPSSGSRPEAVYSNSEWTYDHRKFLWGISEECRNDPTMTPDYNTRRGYPGKKTIRRVVKATPIFYNDIHGEGAWPHDEHSTTDMLHVLYRKEQTSQGPVIGHMALSLPAAITRAARAHNDLAQQQNFLTAPTRMFPVMASLNPVEPARPMTPTEPHPARPAMPSLSRSTNEIFDPMDLDSPVDDHQSSWGIRHAEGTNPFGLSRAPYRPLPFNSMGGGRRVQQAASSSAVHDVHGSDMFGMVRVSNLGASASDATSASSGAGVKRLGSPFEMRSYGPKTSGVERAQPPVREANSLPVFAGARLPFRTEVQDSAEESSVRQPRPVPVPRPRLREDLFLGEPIIPEITRFFFVGRAELGARHDAFGSHTESVQHHRSMLSDTSDPFTSPGNSIQRGQEINDSADALESRDTTRADPPNLPVNTCTEFVIVTPNPVRPPPMPRRTCDYGPCDDDEDFWTSPPTVGISAFMERLMAPTAAQREVDNMRNQMRQEEKRETEEREAEEAPSLRINGRLLLMGTGGFALDDAWNFEGV